MKKTYFFLILLLLAGNLFAAGTWDIIDKSMANWNVNGGSDTNKAWTYYIGNNLANNPDGYSITQENGFVNLTKTYVNATNSSAILNSTGVNVTVNTPYTVEFKARINPINKTEYPDVVGTGWELNMLSARINKKTTDIYLGYNVDGNGYVTLKKDYPAAETDRVYRDISGWHVYSLVLSADNQTFDVYIDGDLVFENAATADMNSASNILRLGTAAERARCNIDVEYAKMGTGDFYSESKISSVTLSHNKHFTGNESTVLITANTLFIDDGKELLFSLVDENENEVVAPVEGIVTNNTAAVSLVIPAAVSNGIYYVKVAAPNNQIGSVAVEPKTVLYLIEEEDSSNIWDIIDKSMKVAWDADDDNNTATTFDKAWTTSKKDGTVTQGTGYVNVTKTAVASGDKYCFLIPQALTLSLNTAYSVEIKARTNAVDKSAYPDTDTYFESNQLSARLNTRNMAIHLKHGGDNTGYISILAAKSHTADDEKTYKLNTSEWHTYKFVFYADNSMYDVYIDDNIDPVFEFVPTSSMSGSNIIRLGSESNQRCNMDIEYVKMGTGDFYSNPKISSVVLSSDSHIASNQRTITVTTNTVKINDDEKLFISMVDEAGVEVVTAVELTVSSDNAQTAFTIPAALGKGKYFIQAAVEGNKIGNDSITPKKVQYVIVDPSPFDENLLPNVTAIGFAIEMEDYQIHKPISNEFIFPAVIDIKPYTQDGKFLNGEDPIDRYYRYYTPHENPGGMYLATGPTLDGPWTEYAGSTGMLAGTAMDFEWARQQSDIIENGAERHISACQVVWNDVYGKYFMYFHGPNTTTHYATSDNLIDWTFGASILTPKSFGAIGAEASYAKVFEYKLPDLNNKYVLMLMIAESSTSRKIYWAHSKDGIDWTCSSKPLVSPNLDYKKIPGTDTKPIYSGNGMGNNVAGPFFMRSGGRNFVFFNTSSNNICVAEIGDNFDMEVHWGEYMSPNDALIDKGSGGNPSAVGRVAAPVFIQNDEGKWYMFFEAGGGRLSSNIAYAKELGESGQKLISAKSISISSSFLNAGQTLAVTAADNSLSEVVLYNIAGNVISRKPASGNTFTFNVPASAGLYVLSVKLDNNLSKEFKILVK